jgi:glycine cleavage system aminomethyltransferase T
MTSAAEIEALRTAAGRCRLDHVAVLRVDGPDAFALLDRVSTRPLFLRETQLCHTLFLREDAGIFADVFVALGEDAFYVLAEGPTEAELLAYLDSARGALPVERVSVHALGASHARIGIDGPYAWEVTAALLGPAVLGMPYLTLMHVDFGLCLRAGKTGEYGYILLADEDGRVALEASLQDVGAPLGLREVGLAALDRCALENWHFSMRALHDTPLARPLTALELQLQWRVGWDRQFVGAEALRRRRAEGPALRTACVTAEAELARGQVVACGDEAVGELLDAGWSFTRAQWVGMALLPRALAHPHLSVLTARTAAGEVALRTQTAPLLDNRSLHVDPHRHSHRTREQDAFPPLVAS